MTPHCLLDLFPVEIVRMIFEYLWAHQIFDSFFHISDYVDRILLTYDEYQVNFQSIVKNDFDLICENVQPDQVISLILSDGNETPGQSGLFLSFFYLRQFVSLSALQLIEIVD